MPRRDETGTGITQRTRVLKDVWADTAGNVVDQAGNVVISAAAQALVSAHGNLANGQMVGESAPNTVITDNTTTGVGLTLTQMGFITIPGGAMGLRTRLQVGAIFDVTGNDSKDVRLFAGPASGTFATAISFSGRFGFTGDRYQPLLGLIYNENSMAAQRASASGQPDWPRNNASGGTVALTIDTTLDWNIYVGGKFNLANGAPANTLTLRNFWVQVIG